MLKRLAPIPRLVPAPRSLQPTSEPTIGNLVGDGVRAGLKRNPDVFSMTSVTSAAVFALDASSGTDVHVTRLSVRP